MKRLLLFLFLIIGCKDKEQLDLDEKFEKEAELLRQQSLVAYCEAYSYNSSIRTKPFQTRKTIPSLPSGIGGNRLQRVRERGSKFIFTVPPQSIYYELFVGTVIDELLVSKGPGEYAVVIDCFNSERKYLGTISVTNGRLSEKCTCTISKNGYRYNKPELLDVFDTLAPEIKESYIESCQSKNCPVQ